MSLYARSANCLGGLFSLPGGGKPPPYHFSIGPSGTPTPTECLRGSAFFVTARALPAVTLQHARGQSNKSALHKNAVGLRSTCFFSAPRCSPAPHASVLIFPHPKCGMWKFFGPNFVPRFFAVENPRNFSTPPVDEFFLPFQCFDRVLHRFHTAYGFYEKITFPLLLSREKGPQGGPL